MGGRDAAGDFREQAHAIERTDLDLGFELPFDAARAVDGDPLRRLLAVLGEISAAIAMNDDAAAARHEADDLVAGDRVAAMRVTDDGAFRSRDLELSTRRRRRGSALVTSLREHARDDGREPLAQADLLEQRVLVRKPELFEELLEPRLRGFLQAQRIREQLLADERACQVLCRVALQV